jgi:lipoprotein NlpI
MAYRLIIIFLFSYFVGFSQDSAKVFGLLQQSSQALKKSNVKSSMQLAHQALSFSNSSSYNKGLANVYNQLGIIFESQSNYDSANYYLIKSVDIAQSPTLKNELAVAHNLLGLVLWHQSQYK